MISLMCFRVAVTCLVLFLLFILLDFLNKEDGVNTKTPEWIGVPGGVMMFASILGFVVGLIAFVWVF